MQVTHTECHARIIANNHAISYLCQCHSHDKIFKKFSIIFCLERKGNNLLDLSFVRVILRPLGNLLLQIHLCLKQRQFCPKCCWRMQIKFRSFMLWRLSVQCLTFYWQHIYWSSWSQSSREQRWRGSNQWVSASNTVVHNLFEVHVFNMGGVLS